MRAVVYTGAGGPEVLSVVERPDPEPGTGEVLLAVTHAALNPADVAQREGRYPAPAGVPAHIGGIEVAGEVVKCGPGATRWAQGDRVFGLVGGGGFADRVVAHELHLAGVPSDLSDEEAAAVPEAFITAHDALVANGGMRPGDRVLVNGANGGVGSAAVQLAVASGAEVAGTCRSDAGLEVIRQLGARAFRHEPRLDDAAEVGPFDVIVELVGGPNLSRAFDLVAGSGRIVVVGVPAGDRLDVSVRPLMRRRASLVGTNLRNRALDEKAAAVRAFAHEVVPLLAHGRVRALVEATYPHTEAAAAFSHLGTSGKSGKVLLTFTSRDRRRT